LAKSPKSHLLEELRAKAESVSAKRVEQQQLSRGVVERVDGRLHAVFQYFDEACKLLQIIAPAIERDFSQPQIVRYTANDLVNLMLGKPNPLLLRAPLRGFGR
jgi:hypothetical protein